MRNAPRQESGRSQRLSMRTQEGAVRMHPVERSWVNVTFEAFQKPGRRLRSRENSLLGEDEWRKIGGPGAVRSLHFPRARRDWNAPPIREISVILSPCLSQNPPYGNSASFAWV
ncbi:hypothetical protein KM043_015846 [Ampulex compressa]|nr:hypothetical protein KM043_015846 [Ampulex compressa]